MHVGAQNCIHFGFGMALVLNRTPTRNCAYDASVYDGVYFWARSGQNLVTAEFQIGTRSVNPLDQGGDGTCEPHCWDRHLALVELTPVWKQYSVRWADLKQRCFGKPVRFETKQILSITLSAPPTPRNFREIWIDQVAFFKGTPPRSPFESDSERLLSTP